MLNLVVCLAAARLSPYSGRPVFVSFCAVRWTGSAFAAGTPDSKNPDWREDLGPNEERVLLKLSAGKTEWKRADFLTSATF